MAHATRLLAALALLCRANLAGADRCDDVFACHAGEDIDFLKQWLNSKLGCNCVNDPKCTCVGLCQTDFCKNPKVTAIVRAPDLGFCDPGLQTLKEAVLQQCLRQECCKGCDIARFAETQRACAHAFSNLETTLSAVYAAVVAIAYISHVTAPTNIYRQTDKSLGLKF